MEYIRAGKLVAARARSYSAEVLPLARDLADALLDVLLVSTRLAAALARPLLALLLLLRRVAQPLVAAAVAAAWHSFVAQTPQALAAEAAGTSALAFLLLLEQRFGVLRSTWRTYRNMANRAARAYAKSKLAIREKSKFAAASLAHALFLIPTAVVLYFFGPVLDAFIQSWGLFLVSFAHPAYRTVAALYIMDIDDVSKGLEVEDLASSVMSRSSPRAARSNGSSASKSGDLRFPAPTPERRTLFSASRAITPATARDSAKPSRSADAPGEDDSLPNQTILRDRRGNTSRTELEAPVESSVGKSSPSASVKGRLEQRRPLVSEQQIARAHEIDLLRFWSVFGLAWAARGMVRYFIPAMLRRFQKRLDSLLFFFLLWLQLGFTHGTEIMFSLIAKTLRQGQYLSGNSSRAEQLNIFLRMLVAVGLVQPDRAPVIASTVTESGLALLGVVFFITPRVATFIGTLLIGLIVPVYFTVSASSATSLPIARYTWLSYWAVYGLVDAIYTSVADLLNWLPLWYHAKLALILWLQLPYYRGASWLLDEAMSRLGTLVSMYRKKTVTPRKRKLC
jgi:TB2/DP1, HVA22 family